MSNPLAVTAVRLRLTLLISLLLAVVIVIAGIVYTIGYLNSYAASVNQVVGQADVGDKNVTQLRKLTGELDKRPLDVARAEQVVAESKDYQYQNVIVEDLQALAKQSGLDIVSFNFAAAAAATPAPAAAATPGAAAAPAAPAASSLRSRTVDITLDQPANYTEVLRFIGYIEQNLTKMQIKGITLAGQESSTESASSVSVNTITVEVYVQ